MKRERAEFPYEEYYLYVVFHSRQNRNYANLIPIDPMKNKRKTISYARYLMSVKEKRVLEPHEQVDHKDNNKRNDDINNLQILTVKQNNQKEALRRGGKTMVELKCPMCGKLFSRQKRNTFMQQGSSYTACSKKCAGSFAQRLKHDRDSIEVRKAIDSNVVRIYKTAD